MKGLSSRFHLAFGLSAMVGTVLLVLMLSGLMPDRAAAQREARVALSEATALVVASHGADVAAAEHDAEAQDAASADAALAEALRFVVQRNPQLRGVSLWRADGSLRLQVGEALPAAAGPGGDPRAMPPAAWRQDPWAALGDHVAPWRDRADAAIASVVRLVRGGAGPDGGRATHTALLSTDELIRLPLAETGPRAEGQPPAAGQMALWFEPLHGRGWFRPLAGNILVLIALTSGSCFVAFYFYLRRMLRHLDPSRVIPGRVRTAFDTLAEGLMVLDARGRIVLANKALADVIGEEAEALVGRKAEALAWELPAAANTDDLPWKGLLEDGRPRHNVLLYFQGADGRRYSFMVNGSPVPGANGKPAGVLVSLDDVTALEEQEIQLRLARDEAEAANRAKSDFLANMSHEIRTPMNAILGFAQLLRRSKPKDAKDADRYLDTILGSGKLLLNLINDILDLSKVEAGKLEVERIPCPVHHVLHQVVTVMKVRADEKGVDLTLDFPESLPGQVLTDPARLTQVVTNLVGNALKFTSEGGVTLRTTLRPGAAGHALLAIDVIDTGIGIPQDKLEAIFEPFVQAEASTTRKFGGTGLGLAISRRLARALGGDVVASSVPGEGSTFHITIQTGDLTHAEWLQPAQLAEPPHRADDGSELTWTFPPRTVLVVDDGDENRELLRMVLEPVGLKVIEAADGQQGVDRALAQAPDLVLMDVQMPVMDGYTATRTLRERGFRLPIYALTANAMKGFEKEVEAAGFSGFLTKPVDIDGLLAELGRRLGGQAVKRVAGEAAAALRSPESAPAPAPAAVAEATAPVPAVLRSRLADHPRLGAVAARFATALPARLGEFDEARAALDFDRLKALGHWLKGAGGTVGYDDLHAPAAELEQAALARDVAKVDPVLARLRALASAAVAGLDTPSSGVSTAAAGAAPTVPAACPAAAVADAGAPIESRLAHHPRLAAVAGRFVAGWPERAAQFEAAAAEARFEDLARLAHWLKGSAGSVGFDAFHPVAVELEHAAEAQDRARIAHTLDTVLGMGRRMKAPAAIAEHA